MAMVRKQIYIETEQDNQLKRISRKLSVPEAELIRQGINLYLTSSYTLPLGHARWEEAREISLSGDRLPR
jgi:hypothetical protein